ncbi:hypothetical protein MHW47_10785 [Streptomyces sp. OfavH-34-F]|uniref:zinc finger domain-containing protein n=1 Tax=Streptomyces sp. OfavH-34-F TaxID=2917760 RepID=UPI001EF1CA24|nr:hypothetical protein [Streptomyces sp. OfavH-34-F]MCG7524919.1 hypothetical protein [Streptomyces sp. OfavH-34-F]
MPDPLTNPTSRPSAAAAPALALPAIRNPCPTCTARPGELCTSHGGTRIRPYNVHQARNTNR